MGNTCSRKIGSTAAISTVLDLGATVLVGDPDSVTCHITIAGTSYTSTASIKHLNTDGTVTVTATIPANGGHAANEVAGKYPMDWHVVVGATTIKVPDPGHDVFHVEADG